MYEILHNIRNRIDTVANIKMFLTLYSDDRMQQIRFRRHPQEKLIHINPVYQLSNEPKLTDAIRLHDRHRVFDIKPQIIQSVTRCNPLTRYFIAILEKLLSDY